MKLFSFGSGLIGASLMSIVLVGMVLARSRPNNPHRGDVQSLEAALHPPAQVASTLRRACFDCHSNETRWPWYSSLPMVGSQIRDHVEVARLAVNFSEWRDASGTQGEVEAGLLTSVCESVRSGAMPLPNYALIHRDARVTPDEARALCAWTQAESQALAAHH